MSTYKPIMMLLIMILTLGLTNAQAQVVWQTADQTTNASSDDVTTSITVNKPSNLALGDLIVITVVTNKRNGTDGESGISPVTLGFTLVNNATDDSNLEDRPDMSVYYKVATAADLLLTEFEFATNASTPLTWRIVAGRVTGFDPYNPISLSNSVASSSAVASLIAPTLTPIKENSLHVAARTVRNVLASSVNPLSLQLFGANGEGSTDNDLPALVIRSGDITTTDPTPPLSFTWVNDGYAAAINYIINAPIATQLGIDTQPSSSAQAGVNFPQQPSVQLLDFNGDAFSELGVDVTVEIFTGDGTLLGTTTVSTDANGLATFTDLAIGGIIGDRVLRFTATGLTSVDSDPITITPGLASAANSTITVAPTAILANAQSQALISVQLIDTYGNLLADNGDNNTVVLSRAPAFGTIGNVTYFNNGIFTAPITSSASPAQVTITGTVNSNNIADDAVIDFAESLISSELYVSNPNANQAKSVSKGDGQMDVYLGPGSDVIGCGTTVTPCATLGYLLPSVAAGDIVWINGAITEIGTVNISSGQDNITIRGLGTTDPTDPTFANITFPQATSTTQSGLVIDNNADGVTIRDLAIRFASSSADGNGRLLFLDGGDDTLIENVTFEGTSAGPAIRHAILNDGTTNTGITVNNSRFTGRFVGSANLLQAGFNYTYTNNVFDETYVGTLGGGTDVGSIDYGINLLSSGSINISYNRFKTAAVPGANNNEVSAVKINGAGTFPTLGAVSIFHNTFALNTPTYAGAVSAIHVTGVSATLLTNLSLGYITIEDNIITGARNAGGTGTGFRIAQAYSSNFIRYNLFHSNDSPSTQPVASIAPYFNLVSANPADPATDPLFLNMDDFGLNVASPAYGTSSTGATPNANPLVPSPIATPNRGYNQIVNTTPPTVAFTSIDNPLDAGNIRQSDPTRFEWAVTDPDPSDFQKTYFLEVANNNTFDNVFPNVLFTFNGTLDAFHEATIAYGLTGGTWYARVTVTDQIDLPGTSVVTPFTVLPNVAPTAGTFLVDDVSANPAVNNAFPTFKFTYEDDDSDPLAQVRYTVSRVSRNCGVACPEATPGAPYLVWDSGLITAAVPANGASLAVGSVIESVYGYTGAITEAIRTNESYIWSVTITDGINAPVSYVINTPAPGDNAELVFTTVENTTPALALTLDTKSYAGGVLFSEPMLNVATATPTFEWTYQSFDAMLKYEIDVATDAAFTAFVWQTGEDAAANAAPGANPNDFESVYAGAGLATGTQYYARVRVFNQLNNPSPWQYTTFELNVAPGPITVFTGDGLDLLAGLPLMQSIAPKFEWTFADLNGDDAQSAFQIRVYNLPGPVLVHDSGKQTSTDAHYQMPDNLLAYNDDYQVTVELWDSFDVSVLSPNGSFLTPMNVAPVVTIDDVTVNAPIAGTNYFVDNQPASVTFTFDDPSTENRPMASFRVEYRSADDVTQIATTGQLTPAVAVNDGDQYTYTFDPADFGGTYNLVVGTSYRLIVHAFDNGTVTPLEGSSAPYNFTFVSLPSAPTALAVTPTRIGGLINSVTPQFSFTHNDADGEASVHFDAELLAADGLTSLEYVDATAAAIANGASSGAVNYTDVFTYTLVPNNTYNLRVRTADIHGDGAWSALVPFTVNPIPAAPTAIAVSVPPVTTQLNLPNGPTFNIAWTNNDFGFDAVEYRAEIYDAGNAVSVESFAIMAAGAGNTGSFTPTVALTPGTTYTLRLRVGDDASASTLAEFSPEGTASFRVSAAPTLADIEVDAVANNPEVLNVFPTFSWTYDDIDADLQSALEVMVTRTSNVGGLFNAAPYLVWNSGKIMSANPSVIFGDGGPVIEGILPGESYSFTVRVWDANDIPSTVYNGTFTAGVNLPVGLNNLTLDGQSYVPGGTLATRWLVAALNVATGTPTFAWNFGGPGVQAKYQIEVSDSPSFSGFVHQTGEVVSSSTTYLYSGAALSAGMTYYARVRAFNGQNIASDFQYVKFVLNQAPGQPSAFMVDGELMNTNLAPSIVTDDRIPTFTWVFEDPNLLDATDEQTEFILEIGDNVPFTTPIFTYDSEGVSPVIDGSLLTFTVPVNQLKFNTVYAARVKVKDKHGVQSATWLYGTFRTPANIVPVIADLAVSDGNPSTNPAQILTLEPDFAWGFSDGDGHGHGFSRVVVTAGATTVYDTGIVANASSAHTFDAGNELNGGFAWGESYVATVTSWDDFSDPLNFGAGAPNPPNDIIEQVSNTLTLPFSTSAFNLMPTSLTISPSVINTLQTTTITAQLSTPYAWATLTASTGVETFFASIQADAAGVASMNSGALPAGNYTFRAFETPVALNAGNWLAATYGNGASLVQASLLVVNAGGLLGDANLSGGVSALDAVFILQYVAGLQTMTPTQLALGDVDGLGGVNSFDAAQILQFDAGIITCFPLNCPPKVAVLAPEASLGTSRAQGGSDIVLSVTGNEMLSVQYTLDLAGAGLTAGDVTLSTPEGWMSVTNEVDGVLTVVMAGARSVGSIDLATISGDGIDEARQLAVTMLVNNEALSASVEVAPALPDEFALGQNFPNPFNPSTEIAFSLPTDANVVLEVYSITGQKVATLANKGFKAGQHTVRFDASRLSSGVYIYRIQAGAFTATNKMTLIK